MKVMTIWRLVADGGCSYKDQENGKDGCTQVAKEDQDYIVKQTAVVVG
jgi:hypothetical protein